MNYTIFSRIKENIIKSPEYYDEGSRKLSILHARIRHHYSSLNADLFRINITNDPKRLFRSLKETHTNIETLLFGNDEINRRKNSMIFNKVRAYIKQTKRF